MMPLKFVISLPCLRHNVSLENFDNKKNQVLLVATFVMVNKSITKWFAGVGT